METMTEIQKVIEGSKKNVQDVRVIKKLEIGQGYRQGDIYVYRVPADHPHGKKLASHKLAIGQGEGSNHFAEGKIEVFQGTQVPEFLVRGTFLGPLIKAPKGFKNTHPKHAHFDVKQGGVYQVIHQTDARTLQRVRD